MELWPYVWCPNLLIFAGDQHRCHANKLELTPWNWLQRQVPVYDVYGEIERFWHEIESIVSLNEPIHEDSSHFGAELGLITHVVTGTALMLQQQRWCMVMTDSEQACSKRVAKDEAAVTWAVL